MGHNYDYIDHNYIVASLLDLHSGHRKRWGHVTQHVDGNVFYVCVRARAGQCHAPVEGSTPGGCEYWQVLYLRRGHAMRRC